MIRLTQLAIYGAKSLALGVCLAVQELYPEYLMKGFIVKSLTDNPSVLAKLPVKELKDVTEKEIFILIATPEDTHKEIVHDLEQYGFFHYSCIDSKKEAELMGKYYYKKGVFPSIHLMTKCKISQNLLVYMAKHHEDRMLNNNYKLPDWIQSVSVGACLSNKRLENNRDDIGDNISNKNGNYCELTALYWIWKNKLFQDQGIDYYGLFHYRRILDIETDDLFRLKKNDIDVVLPYPTVHEPNIFEHHTRYLKESDWKAMVKALEELQPDYAEMFPHVLAQPYFYNYNILIAKSSVLEDYCSWLFPILERTEEYSMPKGRERSDRYIGYLGENLLTLYFMYHSQDLNIAHTGRYMLV